MTRRLAPVLLFVACAIAACGAIRSYDLFWQLATGRWIVEHRALPASDPFALASDRGAWIDGEWLYEVALYATHSVTGLRGLSIVRGLLAALVFTLAFLFARREGDEPSALLLTAISFAGALPLFDLRPSGVAALLVVLMLGVRPLWARLLLAVLWINIHPSALLAPLVGALRKKREAVATALALLVNPHGYHSLIAPIGLALFVRSGKFVNAEWLPSSPSRFPLLYVCMGVGVLLWILAYRTTGDLGPAPDWYRLALLALFAFLAVQHVRNQPLFFAAFPLLVPLPRLRPAIAYAAAAIALVLAFVSTDHRLGVPPERFPIAAVERLRATSLRGNLYNADQFGGYLIWSFYPERRVLTDGRNELYRAFIPEWQAAREDGRKWDALLRKYRIDLAVEEYRAPLRVIDARTGKPVLMPAHLAYWPKEQWALIARDDAAMVFARRATFPGVERWELSSPVRADR